MRVKAKIEFFYDDDSFPEHFFDDTRKMIASISDVEEWAKETYLEDMTEIVHDNVFKDYVIVWIEND